MDTQINNEESIITSCYGVEKTWKNRKEPIDFFTECMALSEGSEQERYRSILKSLYQGEKRCVDISK